MGKRERKYFKWLQENLSLVFLRYNLYTIKFITFMINSINQLIHYRIQLILTYVNSYIIITTHVISFTPKSFLMPLCSWLPLASGSDKNWSAFFHTSFAFPRVLYKWNHIVCSLSHLTSRKPYRWNQLIG